MNLNPRTAVPGFGLIANEKKPGKPGFFKSKQ
jgi:hypothetical protein